jgi:hypothetical protein
VASVDPTEARKHVRTPGKPSRRPGQSCGESFIVIYARTKLNMLIQL